MKLFLILSAFIILFSDSTHAQFYGSGMTFLTNSRSVASYGLAQQGVTIKNSTEAMTYNPANIVFQKDFQISYFYDPYYFYFPGITYRYFATSYQVSDNVFVGIDYYNSNSEYTVTTEFDPIGNKERFFERSVSFSLAQKISSEFNYGAQLRYSWLSFPMSIDANSITVSAGMNYEPELFNKKILFGLSLMNFGFPFQYKENKSNSIPLQKDATPSVLYLGTTIEAVKEDIASIHLNFQASKLLAKYSEPSFEPQSGFQSLFNDWTDAPRDMVLNSGLSILWTPLDLGNAWTVDQQWYFGHRNNGPKIGNTVSLFHGLKIGIGHRNTVFTFGYAGETFSSSDFNRYFRFTFPKEVFQFDITIKDFQKPSDNDDVTTLTTESNPFEKIIFNFGGGRVNRFGHNSNTLPGNLFGTSIVVIESFESSSQYNFSTDFYFTSKSALITQFIYSRIPYTIMIKPNIPFFEARIEDLQISALYRYHPLALFLPVFIEGGLGIQRMNPIESSSPKYFYNSLLRAGLGMQFQIFGSFYFSPKFNFASILREITQPIKRVGGHNQTELTFNIGYSIN